MNRSTLLTGAQAENRLLRYNNESLSRENLRLQFFMDGLRDKVKRLEQIISNQRAANNGKMQSLLRWQKLTGRHYPEELNDDLKYDIGSFD